MIPRNYTVEILHNRRDENGEPIWWPVSDADDKMVIGDGIPGDKKSAELCARCCSIAYEQALDDVCEELKKKGISNPRLFLGLTKWSSYG